MKIGALARATATAVETIRFYERSGLLPVPERASNNYRRYGPVHVETLQLIRSCRAAGLNLEEVRHIVDWTHESADRSSEQVGDAIEGYLADVNGRLEQLHRLRWHLLGLQSAR